MKKFFIAFFIFVLMIGAAIGGYMLNDVIGGIANGMTVETVREQLVSFAKKMKETEKGTFDAEIAGEFNGTKIVVYESVTKSILRSAANAMAYAEIKPNTFYDIQVNMEENQGVLENVKALYTLDGNSANVYLQPTYLDTSITIHVERLSKEGVYTLKINAFSTTKEENGCFFAEIKADKDKIVEYSFQEVKTAASLDAMEPSNVEKIINYNCSILNKSQLFKTKDTMSETVLSDTIIQVKANFSNILNISFQTPKFTKGESERVVEY